MKKAIMLVGLLLGMVHTVLAEECGVFMEFFLRMNPEKDMAVNRAPMCLPVYVAYDTDTHKVKVVGRGAMEGKVFLYNIILGLLLGCLLQLIMSFLTQSIVDIGIK